MKVAIALVMISVLLASLNVVINEDTTIEKFVYLYVDYDLYNTSRYVIKKLYEAPKRAKSGGWYNNAGDRFIYVMDEHGKIIEPFGWSTEGRET